MGVITALRKQKGRKQVDVFVDGVLSFALDAEVVAKAGLRIGQVLSSAQINELKQTDIYHSCLSAALHYLSYRPRSEAEVRLKLRRRGFSDDVAAGVIARLKEQGLIDDEVFARYWKDNRLSFSPRSQQLIKQELRQKGVTVDMAGQAVANVDDEAMAYETGRKKYRLLGTAGYDEFRRRLYSYLRRRGFSHEVATQVVERLWQERQSESI